MVAAPAHFCSDRMALDGAFLRVQDVGRRVIGADSRAISSLAERGVAVAVVEASADEQFAKGR